MKISTLETFLKHFRQENGDCEIRFDGGGEIKYLTLLHDEEQEIEIVELSDSSTTYFDQLVIE